MRYSLLAAPLVLLIDCIIFVNFFMWQQQAVYEFEQRQMDLRVNYSVDGAVQEMLANGTHLGTDYATWGEMVLEPEIALDTYISILIRNMGWADSEKNRQDLIESSMPFFCVAVYDGFYMYSRQHEERTINGVTNTVYEMRWTPKIPYAETIVEAGKPVYYFYNIGESEYGTFSEGTWVLKYDNPLSSSSNGPGSLERSRSVVNGRLTEACNSALYTGLEGDVDNEIFIPSSFSEWSNSNPVMSPSVLTYVSRSDQTVAYDVVTFGMGGAKVDDAEFCICYEYAGSKLYTWADNRAQVEARGSTVLRVTTSPAEAAKAGYYFDISIKR